MPKLRLWLVLDKKKERKVNLWKNIITKELIPELEWWPMDHSCRMNIIYFLMNFRKLTNATPSMMAVQDTTWLTYQGGTPTIWLIWVGLTTQSSDLSIVWIHTRDFNQTAPARRLSSVRTSNRLIWQWKILQHPAKTVKAQWPRWHGMRFSSRFKWSVLQISSPAITEYQPCFVFVLQGVQTKFLLRQFPDYLSVFHKLSKGVCHWKDDSGGARSPRACLSVLFATLS